MKQRPPLYKHQEETVQYLLRRKAAAVLSEQGTGKTRSVIEFVNRKFIAKNFRILVVCPSTLMGVWEKEIESFGDMTDCYLLRGSKKKRKALIHEWKPGWYVINYEGMRVLSEKGARIGGSWDVVIADEMTRIKNPKAKQSKAVHKLGADSPNAIRIGITGTPITQSPLDVFSQWQFVEPRIFGTMYYRFKNRYAIEEKMYMGNRSFPKIVGYKHTDEIVKKIYEVSIRHTKKQCLDLPPKVYQKIEVEWNKDNKKVYDDLSKEMIADLKGKPITVPNALAKLTKLRQVCGGFAYQEDQNMKQVAVSTTKSPEKLSYLIDLIQDSAGSVLVWACFRQDLVNIKKALTDSKISWVSVGGVDSVEERTTAVERFQQGKAKVLVAQGGVAQYGITLTKAETAIFYSQGFSVEDRMQAEDRNHRIGTTESVRYIDLVMKGSVDASIAEVLTTRGTLAKNLTNRELRNIIAGAPLQWK